MRALVVFESMFGNTQKIAEAIADGLSRHMAVEVREVGSAGDTVGDVDLLVVGGPTHTFSMSRESTRRDALERGSGSIVSKGPGIRDWLEELRSDGTPVATFDTKASSPRLPGSASRSARRVLRRHGFRPVAAPTSFTVTGLTGPLLYGEEDRARRWGDQLGLALT